MENQFVILNSRFHRKQENTLIITGWFQRIHQGDNRLSAYLDGEELPLSLEEEDFIHSKIKNRDGLKVSKLYRIRISLPAYWRQGKRLELRNWTEEGCQRKVFPIRRLCKVEKKIPCFVDRGVITPEGFKVRGWYIDDGRISLRILDEKGNSLPIQVEKDYRSDIHRWFGECDPAETVGFQISQETPSVSRLRVQLREGDRVEEYPIRLTQTRLQKAGERARKNLRKTRKALQQGGLRFAAGKVLHKVLQKDSLDYRQWRKRNLPTGKELAAQRARKFPFAPTISIVVPLYRTPEGFLRELIHSVQEQTYANWELCLSDGSGPDSPLKDILREYQEKDARIKVVQSGQPLRISENTNAAIEAAHGQYIAFADHDDLLAPEALYSFVERLNEDPSLEMLYSDEDKVDMEGKEYFEPHFKPDFNLEMLRCGNYICHMTVVSRKLLERVGMLDPAYDGAQDFDFVLRCCENTAHIGHIPKILYHWRSHRNSTAGNPESKEYAYRAGVRAVQAHYDRLHIGAQVEQTEYKGIYRTRFRLDREPLVSILIPNKDHVEDLEKCIRSLEEVDDYPHKEYLIVENNSTNPETFAFYERLERENPRARVLRYPEKGFNYSKLNNFGAREARGDFLLLLNNDTEVLHADCLRELLGYGLLEGVGAVGARLYYEDGTIQHAGVIVGLGGVAQHAFMGFLKEEPGYFGRIIMAQDLSAVTAACMLVSKQVYQEVGGFDPGYAVAFNDVDFCMKVTQAGYRIVYNPYAELKHYESKSRGQEDSAEKVARFNREVARFQERWAPQLEAGDPFYNPNLTLDREDFSLRAR